MRLVSLDLERYGPFTDRQLVFRPDARLHVVFGRNEAGKTSSLAAVSDLLFGIAPRENRMAFLHDGKDLRLSARLQDRKGHELTFRRRRNKPQLSDLNDKALTDDVLAPFHGGLTRDIFSRAFGLDADALRQSSEELKQSDGELGAALFSAAAGLRGLNDLKTSLDREADDIFAPKRAEKRRFYQATDRYDLARKTLRDRETRAGDLKALREALAAHERELETIKSKRAAVAAEKSRLDRLRRAAPVLRAIDAETGRAAALGELPSVAQGLGARLVDAIRKVVEAETATIEARRREAALRAEHDAIEIDEALLARAAKIAELQKNLGAYQKALLDLPRVGHELDDATQALASLAARLGLSEVATLRDHQPDDASRALMADLLTRGETLQRDAAVRAAELAREEETLAAQRRALESSGPLRDPAPFRERLEALSGIVKLAGQIEDQAPALQAEADETARAAARLSPPVRDLDRLTTTSLPTVETISRMAKRAQALDQDEARLTDAIAKIDVERADIETELARLASGTPVPTQERIVDLRAQRDARWATLRTGLFATDAAPDMAGRADTVAAFEHLRDQADRMADLAASDATRVATHAERTRQLTRQTDLLHDTQERLTDAIAAREESHADWTELWQNTDLVPLAPADMTGWRLQVDGILITHARLAERRTRLAALESQVASSRSAFDDLAADLGLVSMPALSIPALARRLAAEIKRLDDAWSATRALETLVIDLDRRVAKARRHLADTQGAHSFWQTELTQAMPRLGLPAGATAKEAQAVLEAWRDVPAGLERHDGLRRRVAGMTRDIGNFDEEIEALIGELGAGSDLDDPQAALRGLVQGLEQTIQSRTIRTESVRHLKQAEALLADREAAHAAASADLAALSTKLPAVDREELADLAQRLAARDAIEATLTTRRAELANTAEGREEASLREALAEVDLDSVEAELARLAEEDHALDLAGQQAFADRRQAEVRLAEVEGATGAEIALQQRRNAETEIVDSAREWLVLKFGARMIETALRRQRQGRQEPLMARAGELFGLLTGGVYSGLGQTYDDSDVPHLTGLREGSNEIDVNRMSEGTRDQLCLALRLAYLEDYATRAEPPPFIGDDLFASFDDERTAHGLRALADIGAHVQPILFTHHAFVVETARRELGSAVDIVNL